MSERLVIEGFEPFVGKHCETSALKRVFDYHGLCLSEDMLFGLGGGIGFLCPLGKEQGNTGIAKLLPAPGRNPSVLRSSRGSHT